MLCRAKRDARVLTAVGAAVVLLVAGLAATAAEQPGLAPPIDIHKGLSDKEWPQLQNTPQRTGYSPTIIKVPFEEKWAVNLAVLDIGNRIQPTVQPIIAQGKVFVGCKNGRFFALNAASGAVEWTFDAAGPIHHTAGFAGGKVFFAAGDGCVYALDAGTGKQVWRFDNERRHGFSTAVLLVEGKVFAVDRGGRLYCLNPSDGKPLWQYDAGAPVCQSPAYSAGNVYFGDERMRVHAVKAADGSGLWRSKKLPGASFSLYWPVVVHGMVIVRSLADDTVRISCGAYDPFKHTERYHESMFLLDEKTGAELPKVEHYMNGCHQGTTPPPAVTRDGLLVARWTGARLDPKNKFFVAGGSKQQTSPPQGHAWALQDLRDKGRMVKMLEPTYTGTKDHRGLPLAIGVGPADETTVSSVIGDMVVNMLCMGWRYYNGSKPALKPGHYCVAHGIYSLTDERWLVKGMTSRSVYANQCSGGVSAVSAAGGLFYNVAWSYVQCHGTAEPVKPDAE
jgi:putative pyrroloquinoline-quinone binding quinoprotein